MSKQRGYGLILSKEGSMSIGIVGVKIPFPVGSAIRAMVKPNHSPAHYCTMEYEEGDTLQLPKEFLS